MSDNMGRGGIEVVKQGGKVGGNLFDGKELIGAGAAATRTKEIVPRISETLMGNDQPRKSWGAGKRTVRRFVMDVSHRPVP